MIAIPIDADFESQPITGYVQTITDPPGCGMDEQGLMYGWTLFDVVAGAGRGVAHWTCNNGMPPSNVAFLLGARMAQVTGESARQDTYVLQFDTANWFYPYPADWKAELYQASPTSETYGMILDIYGNHWKLSPAPFCSESGWVLGDMKRKTVTCDLPGYLIFNGGDSLSVGGQIRGNIAIVFQNAGGNPALGGHSGWPVLIDNVSLTFSPQT